MKIKAMTSEPEKKPKQEINKITLKILTIFRKWPSHK